jgi:hypothetical protein
MSAGKRRSARNGAATVGEGMSGPQAGRDEASGEGARVVKGPWDKPSKRPRPPRQPLLRRQPARGRGREPIINNWKMLVVLLLLLFVAPPVATWLTQVLVHSFTAG